MKHFLILLFLIGFTTSFLLGNHAYGWWVPLSPEELIEQSKTIFVGTVTDITPVDVEYQSQIARNGTVKESVGPEVMTLEEYTVDVEQFLKNPQESDTMTVRRATVGGVPSGPAKISGFEIGDRVLFYLPKDEKQTHFPMQYLPESFQIPKHCDAKSALEEPRIDGKNSFEIFQDDILKQDNFTAGKPVKFVFSKDTSTLYGTSIDVDVAISKTGKNQAIFEKNIHTESEPCQWITSAEWEFTPEEGDYRMNYSISENDEYDSTSYSYTGFSVISDTNTHDVMAPLKQLQSGLYSNEIHCKENLVLIQKHDGSPACVKPETKQKLIERGWAKNYSELSKINTDCMTIEQSKQIASFFKTPTYLPEGYSYVCSRSGMPFESYIVYYYQQFPPNWQIHELVSEGAIFIYQIDERNFVGEQEFQTYGSAEQRIQETYDSVMEGNPSLNPQLVTINGVLAYAVDSCPDCGIQTANFTDGTIIQESTATTTRIKFIDENGVKYMLETTLPLNELIKVAESLQ